jgi:hypothetical protein
MKASPRMQTHDPHIRGGIRWADLNSIIGREQSGSRPVLILSHDVFNENSGTVIVMAITSQPQRVGYPIGERPGRITQEEMDQVIEGVDEIIR